VSTTTSQHLIATSTLHGNVVVWDAETHLKVCCGSQIFGFIHKKLFLSLKNIKLMADLAVIKIFFFVTECCVYKCYSEA